MLSSRYTTVVILPRLDIYVSSHCDRGSSARLEKEKKSAVTRDSSRASPRKRRALACRWIKLSRESSRESTHVPDETSWIPSRTRQSLPKTSGYKKSKTGKKRSMCEHYAKLDLRSDTRRIRRSDKGVPKKAKCVQPTTIGS